eukprot:gene3917-4890_t
MSDPLTMLRDVLMNGQQPVIEGDDFVFGRFKFAKNTPTAFKASTGSQYTLNSVYLCHVNRDLSRGAYVLAAARAGTPAVALNDKKELLQYLDGEITSSASIVFDAMAPTSVSTPTMTPMMMDSGMGGASMMPYADLGGMQSAGGSQYMQGSTSNFNYQSSQQQHHQLQQQSALSSMPYGGDIQSSSMDQDYNRLDHINKKYKIEVRETDLTAEQQKEKDDFSKRLEEPKIQPLATDLVIPETEDDFIEKVKQKRLTGQLEKSDYFISDEPLTKSITQREKVSNDRVSILQGQSVFTNILDSYKKFKAEEEEKKRKPHQKSSNGYNVNSKSVDNKTPSKPTSSSSTNIGSPIGLKNRVPIIIVPSSLTSPLSLYNAKDFLNHSKYIPTINKKQEMSAQNIPKPSQVTFDRINNHQKITYEIIDNIKLLKPEDWGRVAAVFVQGEAWQFKDWKWNNPVDLLENVNGYYMKFDDATLPEVVKSWDVKILNISKSKRHLDQIAQIEFWNSFDNYILAKKPYLNH